VEKVLAATAATVSRLDGDSEDPARTLAQVMTFSLLPGRQIYRVTDSRLFAASGKGKADEDDGDAAGNSGEVISAAEDKKANNAALLADMYKAALEKGFPTGHYLLLTCDNVDKRQRLFTFIKKSPAAVAVDCAVAAGASAAAKNEQESVLRDVVAGRLSAFGKTIEPGALELLFSRSGFHPDAVAIEAEKLALYCGERERISRADVELLTGRTREDALFELTDAFAKGDVGRALATLSHLQYGGVHALAILATMRNFFRRLLIFKALQEQNDPPWRSAMNFQHFQNNYLPALKEKGRFPDQLQGHPYALFNTFTTAARHAIPALRQNLESVLQAEYQLKGSALPTGIVLEEMLVRMMGK
jgi:DNA polymerase-3 subunit delta